MCGIAGILKDESRDTLGEYVELMNSSLLHRGPDSAGTYVEPGIALGHRRLAIIDLTESGHQPMVSSCDRFVMVYNGEIYNTQEIINELSPFSRRGHSDSEIILECISQLGVEKSISLLNGMFALAIWDKRERELHLVRDRLGIKPLYWSALHEGFVFASELKALRALPHFNPSVDRDAVSEYLRYNCIGRDKTIYEGVQKLLPGHHLYYSKKKGMKIEKYWTLPEPSDRRIDAETLNGRVEELLTDSVGRRMVADVPLGVFLSGGLDSSLVASLMQQQSHSAVKTFTMGFENEEFDESKTAAAIAKYIGSDHQEITVSAKNAQDVIPKLVDIYDEPFADISQIPTFLVSEMTKKSVTVALSGDGGDELFAGYNRYIQINRGLTFIWSLPEPLRNIVYSAIKSIPHEQWGKVFNVLGLSSKVSLPREKIYKYADVIKGGKDSFYQTVRTHWNSDIVIGTSNTEEELQLEEGLDFVNSLQRSDILNYLPDDILVKVDRASMANSLEVRVPMLDHRLVELALGIPPQFNIKGGRGKHILRQILSKYMPISMLDGPKKGFSVPIGEWLRGPLREWADHYLSVESLSGNGLLKTDEVRRRWEQHKAGGHDWHYHLWDILMLQVWCERWR